MSQPGIGVKGCERKYMALSDELAKRQALIYMGIPNLYAGEEVRK